MSAVAGRVLLIPKGSYNSGITYNMLDVVTYEYDSYVAKTTTIGHDPTDTTYWQKMTDVGDDVNSLKETFTKNGAVNYYVGSPSFDGYVKQNVWIKQTEKHNGHEVYMRSGTWNGMYLPVYLSEGTYTFSVSVKTNDGANVTLFFTDALLSGSAVVTPESKANIASSTEWTRISGTFVVTQAGYVACRVERSTSGDLYISEYQLELGSNTDTTFEPYAMTNKELTNLAQAEARISAESRAWPGDTLIFKDLPKSNGRWYEFTACVSYSDARFSKGFIILREDGNIVVNGKQGDFTVAYNQDGDLVITLPTSAHWIYDMRRSGELT